MTQSWDRRLGSKNKRCGWMLGEAQNHISGRVRHTLQTGHSPVADVTKEIRGVYLSRVLVREALPD